MAESELSILSRQCTRRRILDRQTLVEEVMAWRDERNADTARIDRRFTTDDARIKLEHLYPTLHATSVARPQTCGYPIPPTVCRRTSSSSGMRNRSSAVWP